MSTITCDICGRIIDHADNDLKTNTGQICPTCIHDLRTVQCASRATDNQPADQAEHDRDEVLGSLMPEYML